MKHKRLESLRRAAKRYAQNWQRPLTEDGHYVPHIYEGEKKLGWWDDVFFKMGSQVVALWWIHPRMAYQDACDEQAWEWVNTDFPLRKGEPVWKRVGRSRKKLAYSIMQPDENIAQRYAAFEKRADYIRRTSDIVITPYYTVKQYDWCRGVDVCMPVEVVNQSSLEHMARMMRNVLMGHCTFRALVDDYTYGREDWKRDQEFLNRDTYLLV